MSALSILESLSGLMLNLPLLLAVQMILGYPSTHPLQSEEKDLLWKYRFYLTRLPQALTKFLKAVSWNDAGEVRQAVEVLLPLWNEVGISDALEMLGPGSRDGRVRAFAVGVMGKADDEVSCNPSRTSGLHVVSTDL